MKLSRAPGELHIQAETMEEVAALRQLADKLHSRGLCLPAALQETLQSLRVTGTLTAAELAHREKIELNAASMRLKRMEELGLLSRERRLLNDGVATGHEYVYRLKM